MSRLIRLIQPRTSGQLPLRDLKVHVRASPSEVRLTIVAGCLSSSLEHLWSREDSSLSQRTSRKDPALPATRLA